MFVFSDESGDNGTRIKNKGPSGGTSSYKVVSMIHFRSQDHAINFLERADTAALEVFGHETKKWKKLKGLHKKDDVIAAYFDRTFLPKDMLISYCIIDKQCFSKPEMIKEQTINAYVYLFKRSVKFWKWVHYQSGRYQTGKPQINWFIDFSNEKDFTEPLSNQVCDFIHSVNVNFNKPIFIHKKVQKEPHYSYKKLIRFSDLIGGVLLNHFSHNNFYESFCRINKHSKGILFNGNKNSEWIWDGAYSIPYDSSVKKIIGQPSYQK